MENHPSLSETSALRIMVLEPLQQGIRLLLNCFLVSLGCVSVSVDDEAFLGNIMELLNLKLRQS